MQISVLIIVLMAFIAIESVNAKSIQQAEIAKAWNDFMQTYKKEYKTEEESNKRREIFSNAYLSIAKHNEEFESGKQTYEQGVNQFTDLTPEEFKKMYLTYDASQVDNRTTSSECMPVPNNSENNNNNSELRLGAPLNFDLRTTYTLNTIRNQGECGSCWAFAVSATLESAYAKRFGKLVKMSEQFLVDCDSLDNGCNGGMPGNGISLNKEEIYILLFLI